MKLSTSLRTFGLAAAAAAAAIGLCATPAVASAAPVGHGGWAQYRDDPGD